MTTPETDTPVQTEKSDEVKPETERKIEFGVTEANSDDDAQDTPDETDVNLNNEEASPDEADEPENEEDADKNTHAENGESIDNKETATPAPQASPDPSPQPEQTSEQSKEESPKEVKASLMKSTAAPFVHDPNKITLRFLFAGRDGIHVVIDCKPDDTVGEVKGALMSVWPEGMPECTGGDRIRLICMGKGILMPDSKTLQAAEVPVFKTHPTPINVSVRPEDKTETLKHGGLGAVMSVRSVAAGDFSGNGVGNVDGNSSSGCCCVIC